MKTTSNNAMPVKKITIGYIIREAWHNVKGLKAPIFIFYLLGSIAMLVLMSVVGSLVATIIEPASAGDATTIDPRSWPIATVLFITFLLEWYILCVAVILGVRKAIGLPAKIKNALSDCWQAKNKLFLLFLIYTGFIALGIVVSLVIPHSGIGVVLQLIKAFVFIGLEIPLLIFALPLIVTKRCGLFEALKSCYSKMRQYWLTVILCFVIIGLIIAVSIIPVLLGLIWSAPLYFAFVGVMFREAYSLKANTISE